MESYEFEKICKNAIIKYYKENGEVTHKHFRDVLSYLKKGDCLVLNNTKVIL